MALEKQVVEMPFDKGLEQKVATEIAPDGLIETLENADLSQVGKYVKRKGCALMPTTVLPSGGIGSLGTVTKLASRDNQLIAVSSIQSYLGSGGGAGGAGDVVYGYSEQDAAWSPIAKIPRPTLDTVYSFAQDSQQIRALDSAKSGDIALIAFQRGSNSGSISGGIFAHVIDASSDTVIVDCFPLEVRNSFPQPNTSVKCVSIGQYIFIFWISDANPGTDQIYASRYDRVANTFTAAAAVIGFLTDVDEFDICTDGTHIYVVVANSTTSAWVYKLNTSLSSVSSDGSKTLAGIPSSCSCSTANGVLHVVYNAAGGANGVYFSQTSTGSMALAVFADVFAGGLAAIPTMVLVASVSATEAYVFGWSGTAETILNWIRVTPTATPATSGSIRVVAFVKPFAKPFVLSGRLYIGLAGFDKGSGSPDRIGTDYGYALCELDAQAPTGVTAYSTAMPAATWSTDVAYPFPDNISSCANGGFDLNSTYYIATANNFRSIDFFVSQSTNSPVASQMTFQESGFRLMAIGFADTKRWQTAKHGDSLIFASAVPYCFDGLHAHESGFIWRPAITKKVRNTGTAALPVNTTVIHRVTYEYWDSIQRRWNSVPNIETEAVTDTSTDTASVALTVRPPTVSMKPRGGSYFFGLIRVMFWRSSAAAPGEFIFLGSTVVEPFRTTTVSFTDNLTDDTIKTGERMYTYGGELENYAPPPCRAICSHRDRVFALNTETNELWYTKPLINGRGVEWSRYFKLPLYEKGMALASIESALIVFTDKGIYALQGSGPSLTGTPPDAFSKLYQISSEIGCSERNAAFRTPVGIIFRARQGLWLIDKALSLKYIGSSVESFMSVIEEMISGDIDEKKGVIRFMVRQGSNYYILNYWYDTNRWSYDTVPSLTTMNSAVVHKGAYYTSRSDGVTKASTTLYTDNGTYYGLKVRTHWLRFGNMSQVKRVWRVLANIWVRARCALTVNITRNFGNSGQTEQFTWTANLSAFNGAPAQPRVHLSAQKVTAVKVTLTEELDSTTNTQGLEFLGLGFELGAKRGAVKMRQEISL